MSGVFATLYWRDRRPLAEALAAAEAGDGTDLLQFADQYWAPDSPWSLSAYAAVGCLDRPGPADVGPWDALYRKLRSETPRVGAWVGFELTCVDWPVRAALPAPVVPNGEPPIVVIGTTGDPATPYSGAQPLAAALGSGVVVTNVGVGHTAAPYSDCMGAIVADYLVDVTVPAEGTTCTDPPVDLGPSSTAGDLDVAVVGGGDRPGDGLPAARAPTRPAAGRDREGAGARATPERSQQRRSPRRGLLRAGLAQGDAVS